MEQPGAWTLLGFGENGWGLNLVLATFTTLAVTLLAFIFGGVFGAIVARGKLTGGWLARGLGDVYTTVLRGVPDLLVIYLLYFGGSQLLSTLYQMMGGSGFVGINAFLTGALAVGVVSGAYQAEVFRGAYMAIPKGELEAARLPEAVAMQAFGVEQHGQRIDDVLLERQARERVGGTAQAQTSQLQLQRFMQHGRPPRWRCRCNSRHRAHVRA